MAIQITVINGGDNLKTKSRGDINNNFSNLKTGIESLETDVDNTESIISGNDSSIAVINGDINLLQSPSGNYNVWNKAIVNDIDFLTSPSGIELFTPPSGKRLLPDELDIIIDQISGAGNTLKFSVGTDSNSTLIFPSGSASPSGIDELFKFSTESVVIPEMTPIKMFITQYPTHSTFRATVNMKGILINESGYFIDYTSGLTNRWYANEDVSALGSWEDSVGSNDATLYDNAYVSSSTPALILDNSGDYAEVPYFSNLNTSNLTVCCWIKASSFDYGSWVVDIAVARDGYYVGQPRIWKMGIKEGSIFYEVFGSGNGGLIDTGTPLSLNTWTHIAMTLESGVARKLYMNATEIHSSGMSSIPTGNTTLCIGGINGNEEFNGRIDDVRIYNSILTGENIQQSITATESRY